MLFGMSCTPLQALKQRRMLCDYVEPAEGVVGVRTYLLGT